MRLLHSVMYATLDEIQTIWAAVSEDPLVTIRQLSEKNSLSRTKVYAILKFLEAAGYIEHHERRIGRRVIIPLVPGTLVHLVKWTAPQSKPITESVAEQSR